ncbi:glycosyltransferase family 39 protein [Paraburkholderia sp. Tr-20389]|uniref:ArnT family glycosyltransferase n=1 Tax=Paraburkholderia sp. Tr-20389 TaxID=2703903 RepID=UPI0019810D7B|nr:glycosyltransferase family 39 protein [Paraburkholderia sp. Tr-20389]MBN3758311.1 glycosyltransferase family 39 protein [Paraburkholderia sp. Tr-20389]
MASPRPLRFTVSLTVLPLIIWVLCVAAINPVGNFPLNDDWSYAIAVQRFLQTGYFHPTDWTSTTLVTQVLWGALFSLPFGTSFTVLRIATLVAGALGIWTFGALLRTLGCDRRIALLATATLAFNPLLFALSNTFMTDVGFLTLTLVSTFLFVRYLERRHTGYLIAALAVAVAATLLRQLALFLPIAMAVTLFFEQRRERRDRQALWLAATGIAVCAGAIAGLEWWLRIHGMVPTTYHNQSEKLIFALENIPEKLRILARNAVVAVLYLGWFVFPVLVWRAPALYRAAQRTATGRIALLGITLLMSLSLVVLASTERLMPLTDNILIDSGIGPLTLRDVFDLGLQTVPPLPVEFWVLMTAASLFGGALLLAETALAMHWLAQRYRSRKPDTTDAVRVFLLAGAIVYMAPLEFAGYFDRYLLVPFALLTALIAMPRPTHMPAFSVSARSAWMPHRAIVATALATLALMTWYAVGGTHDYLSWNRARWELMTRLSEAGITPRSVDGGLEVNGLYLYDAHYRTTAGKSWWWVHDDQYVISFSVLPGYRVDTRVDVNQWLPPFQSKVLVLRRLAP